MNEQTETVAGIPSGVSRRDVLATGATSSTVAGVAGCLSGDGTGSSPTPQTVGATDGAAPGQTATSESSGRIGDSVFYDPDGSGPYEDGQAALDAVPPGGTFVIGHGTWDVAEEGRLVVDEGINVVGAGWTKAPFEFGPDATRSGTIIDNTGDDVVDKPPVEFKPADPENPRLHNPSLREVSVMHAGETSPAVRVEALRTLIADNYVSCTNTAPVGISYEKMGFFARALRNQVGGFNDVGIRVAGVGYAHEFYSNHVATNNEGATAAIDIQRHRAIVVGGEYAMPNVDGAAAIRFSNPDGGRISGGYVVEPGIEHTDIGIDIAPEMGQVDNVQVYHCMQAVLHEKTAFVRFGNTTNSKVIFPVIRTNGEIAQWSRNANHCGVVTDADNLAGCTITDDGATNPWIQVTGAATDSSIDDFPTGVPIAVDYAVDENAPAFHDGDSWYSLAGAAQQYAPGE
jgi:hypothetical protein